MKVQLGQAHLGCPAHLSHLPSSFIKVVACWLGARVGIGSMPQGPANPTPLRNFRGFRCGGSLGGGQGSWPTPPPNL